jgi:branched-chain amino acid transport system permease protein
MIVVINLIAMFYGNETKILNPDISESIELGDMILTYSQLYQLFISIILIIAFLLFLKFSKFGVKTRAIRDDNMLCKVFGLNINRMRTFLFVLSGIFAAVGGGLEDL